MTKLPAYLIAAAAILFGGFMLSAPAPSQTAPTPASAALVCAYNASIPVPTDGQFFFAQCNVDGKLIVSNGGGSAATITANVTATSGYTANQLVISDGTHAQATSTPTVTSISTGAVFATGTPPTITGSGTCTISTQVGGASAGTFVATANCVAAETYTLSVLPTAPTGWACDATDRTTAGVVFQQTASSTTTAVLTVRTTTVATNDIIQFKCIGY